MQKNVTKVRSFMLKWSAILMLAVLAVAGFAHMFAPVDVFIIYPVGVVFISLLLDKAFSLSK
jgi:hypothetical protein